MRVFNLLLVVLISVAVHANVRPTGNFIHISDIHYDPLYQPGSPTNCVLGSTGMGCCRKNSIPLDPPGNASIWGDYNCDSPYLLVKNTIEWITNNLQYDFVVYSGDSVNHHDLEQSWESNLDIIKTITLLLQTLGKPIYNVIGNHDGWPTDQLWSNNPIVDDVALLWENDNNTNGAGVRNFTQGGYYETWFNDTFRICAVNSLWYDVNNLVVVIDPLRDWGNQYSWMKSEVNNCTMIAHIGPRSGEATTTFTQFMNTVTPYLELYGHTHQDEYVLTFQPSLKVGLMTPSVVPNFHFPGVRMFKYHVERGQIVLDNYFQYHLNFTKQLTSANFIGYQLWYDAVSAYELKNMTAAAWLDLVERMSTNITLFQIYCENYSVPNTQCDYHSLICGININMC